MQAFSMRAEALLRWPITGCKRCYSIKNKKKNSEVKEKQQLKFRHIYRLSVT